MINQNKTSSVITSKIKFIFLLQVFFWIGTGFLLPQSNSTKTDKDEINLKTVVVESVMPASFINAKPNVIKDSANSLLPFFEKLALLKNSSDTAKTIVRIVHIGDSHVRSHEFTSALNLSLVENFGNAAVSFITGYKSEGILEESGLPGIICQCIGINGAISQNFLDTVYLAKIQQLKPDLIIVSLGTNEAFGKYDSNVHYNQILNLYYALKNYCPAVPILYTTPPGAFRKIYGRYRKNKRIYRKVIRIEENKNVEKAAATIVWFAADHNAAYWDLYNIAGGEKYACQNWSNNGYYQKDKLHFVRNGYALQGNLLYEALIKAYNDYVCHTEKIKQ